MSAYHATVRGATGCAVRVAVEFEMCRRSAVAIICTVCGEIPNWNWCAKVHELLRSSRIRSEWWAGALADLCATIPTS